MHTALRSFINNLDGYLFSRFIFYFVKLPYPATILGKSVGLPAKGESV